MKTKLNKCRFCKMSLQHTFVDLGKSPVANAYLKKEDLSKPEKFYPLHVFVCEACFLVQLPQYHSPEEIFSEYAYFSSYSDTWLLHAKTYVDYMIERFGFNPRKKVIEIASNDGYLLQYFKAYDIPVLGIEPAKNVAMSAEAVNIPTITKFFGLKTSQELVAEHQNADLLIGNNVLAHVPDLNDFVRGMELLLSPRGIITMEFPHLLKLIQENQYDTIYHEHFSYFSFMAVQKIFKAHRLTIFDVEELPTHGGSLRIFARHADDNTKPVHSRVRELMARELRVGLNQITTYTSFSNQVQENKNTLLQFLEKVKGEGKSIVGYGAPAKGNTLLNYCGVNSNLIDYTVDRSPHKQNHFLPGTHIPIFHPDKIKETKPDYLLILPWNLKEEIMEQTNYLREWGGRFIVPIPEVTVFS